MVTRGDRGCDVTDGGRGRECDVTDGSRGRVCDDVTRRHRLTAAAAADVSAIKVYLGDVCQMKNGYCKARGGTLEDF